MSGTVRTPVQSLRADIGHRGWLGSLSTAWRLGAIALRCVDHLRWMRVVRGRTTRRVLTVYPRIAYRPTTDYLFDATSWADRMAMVRTHYAFLNRRHDAPFFDRLLDDDGLTVWCLPSKGAEVSIRLLGPCRQSRHKEGDLTLAFRAESRSIWKVAFSVVPAALFPALARGGPKGRLALYVGQVQGAPGAGDAIREATERCGANAPQDLLMAALAGIAAAWEIDVVLGVHPERQLSRGTHAASFSQFDYSAFWQRYHAALAADRHYVMQLPFEERPIGEIASNHRKRTQTKRKFKRELRDTVAGCVRQHCRGRTGANGTDLAAKTGLHGSGLDGQAGRRCSEPAAQAGLHGVEPARKADLRGSGSAEQARQQCSEPAGQAGLHRSETNGQIGLHRSEPAAQIGLHGPERDATPRLQSTTRMGTVAAAPKPSG